MLDLHVRFCFLKFVVNDATVRRVFDVRHQYCNNSHTPFPSSIDTNPSPPHTHPLDTSLHFLYAQVTRSLSSCSESHSSSCLFDSCVCPSHSKTAWGYHGLISFLYALYSITSLVVFVCTCTSINAGRFDPKWPSVDRNKCPLSPLFGPILPPFGTMRPSSWGDISPEFEAKSDGPLVGPI
jgi:hypothetical protein